MKKKSWIIALISIILIFSIYFIYNTNKSYRENENLNKLIELIINGQLENYSQEERESLKTELIYTLKNSKQRDEVIKANTILANICIEEKNNIEAENYLNEAIKYIDNYKDTRVKGLIYFNLSSIYLYNKEYEKSSEMFEEMKEICKSKEDELIVKFGKRIGIDLIYAPNGKEKCAEIYEEILDVAKKIEYEELEDIYLKLGIAYWYSDRFVESIEAKLEAIKIAQSKGSDSIVAKIYTDIGVDYLYQKEYEDAVVYLINALSYITVNTEDDNRAESYALLNLCEAYTSMGEYEEAQKYLKLLEESIDRRQQSAIKEDYLTFMYLNKAALESEVNNPEESLRLLGIAKSRYEKRAQFTFLDFDIELVEEYGDAYYKLGDFNKALEYHKELEKMVIERSVTYLEESVYEKIYNDYKAINDEKNAMEYLEKSFNITKENSSKKQRQYSHYLASKFEKDVNEEEILKLSEFKESIGIVVIILVVSLIIISIFTHAIYKKNKEINRLNKMFKELSVTDFITKLQNRRFLDEYLEKNWPIYKAKSMMIAFMMIDIDYFKRYNDNYGHIEGDKAIISVAKIIKESCRERDFVARYGGEEFCIVMIGLEKSEVIKFAKRINENIYNLNVKHEYSDASDNLTVSIGIYSSQVKSDDEYNTYIKKADEALYKAKENGRNRYTIL